MTSISIVAYLALFTTVALAFVFASLLIGRFLRPRVPSPQKLETYECGEPAVGSSYVQFDLRFYVVALVFIVFEVEVALFFPPAATFGTATRWMKSQTSPSPARSLAADLGATVQKKPAVPPADEKAEQQKKDKEKAEEEGDARALALAAAIDLGAFFALILLGFAYVWRRGDLDWVRAIGTSPSRSAKNIQLVQ
jgi:NADH-quinone oxidoreductase subunit A